MNRIVQFTLFCFFFSFPLLSQEFTITPRDLTNRPLGYANDATAVGWNPAILALAHDEAEAVIALPISNTFTRRGPLSIFGKLDNFALGFISSHNYAPGIETPTQLYLGFGLDLGTDFKLGVSGNWVDARSAVDSNTDKIRYNFSFVTTPFKGLIATGGISTMYYGVHNSAVYNVGMNYSPLKQLTIHADVKYADDFSFYGRDMDILGGASYGFLDNHIITSLTYRSALEQIIFGVEGSIGILSAGLLADTKTSGVADGVALLRISSLDQFSNAPALRGIGGGISISRDADCVPEAFKWLGRVTKSPKDLLGIIRSAGESYESLEKTLSELSPDQDKLFDVIRDRYYPHTKTNSTETKGTLTKLFKINDEKIYVEKIDSTDKVAKKAIVQVRDNFGRNVSGLSKRAFSIADTGMVIHSVEQIVSSKSVPADIIILMDCSGSMSSSINAVRTNVENFVRSVSSRGIDARIGCILYGDDILNTLEPTTSVKEFEQFFTQAHATEPDEVSSEAIYRAANMNFRPNAQRVVILITDDCSLQQNADHTEESLTKDLWKAGAQLYSVVNTAKHNAGIVTRLTLGRDYDISQPFTEILDNISGDITTTYEIVYGQKPIEKPKVFVIRGTVTDDKKWALGAQISASGMQGNNFTVKSNPITGKYEIVLPITKKDSYTAIASAGGFFDATEVVNASNASIGDTLTRNFILRKAVITLCGSIKDENNKGIKGKVLLEDAKTLQIISEIETESNGSYCFEIPEKKELRLSAKIQDYISTPVDFTTEKIKKGEKMDLDIKVMSIDYALSTGATFKLKNIFFEFAKADINAASAPELQKLYDFLNEYPTVRVEVSAHTDAVGSDDANMTLSNNRAKAVVDYLVTKGINISRMIPKGYGETKPVGDNNTDEGRAQNRRVEFKLIR